MRKPNAHNLSIAFVLGALFCAVIAAGQTGSGPRPKLENQLRITPSPTPTPRPDVIMVQDYLPGKPLPEFSARPAYYIQIRGVTGLLISDDQGNTDDLFFRQYPQPRKVRYVTYNYTESLGNSFDIVLPVDETYSLTLESKGGWSTLEIVKGVGNTSPDEAIRYCDLDLGGKKARLEITPQGVKPLLLDTNDNGRFDSVVEATAWLRGKAAKDIHGPVVNFRVLQRNATSLLISIEAHDEETAVKSVMYTIDRRNLLPYKGPFRISLDQAALLLAWADDYSGNRGVALFQERWAPKN